MSDPHPPLGVALLSGVHHQDYLSAAFAANRHCRIVAVGEEPGVPADFRERAVRLAERYAVPFVEDVGALLARPDVDVVSVGSEITRHARLAFRAMQAGKHVHVDKPMAATLADSRALAAAAREAEQRGAKIVSFSRVLTPAVQRARAAIERGAIGVPRAARADLVVTYGPGEDFDPARDERRFHPRWTGGGELILHAVYPLTNVRYLIGQELTSVQCFAGALFNRYSREFGTDDAATLVLGTTGGATVQVSLARAHAPSHPGQADIAVRVLGTTGWVAADEQKPALTVCGRPSSGLREILYDADSVQEFIDHFVWCILHDRPPVQTIADGARVMEAVFAAEESARTGRVVRIPSER
jgi:predicted dehydrogenase